MRSVSSVPVLVPAPAFCDTAKECYRHAFPHVETFSRKFVFAPRLDLSPIWIACQFMAFCPQSLPSAATLATVKHEENLDCPLVGNWPRAARPIAGGVKQRRPGRDHNMLTGTRSCMWLARGRQVALRQNPLPPFHQPAAGCDFLDAARGRLTVIGSPSSRATHRLWHPTPVENLPSALRLHDSSLNLAPGRITDHSLRHLD